MGICKTHGLDEEICKSLHEGGVPVKITREKRRFGKMVTIIVGIPPDQIKEVTTDLKTKCAAGGTHKDGKIEIQGDHERKVRSILAEKGFSVQ